MHKEIESQRITQKDKNAIKKRYYREYLDSLDTLGFTRSSDGVSEITKMKVNYDLFNNKFDSTEFSYVCKPFGAEVGDLPATFENRDIISGKIKAILGMEAKRPFGYFSLAVNEQATTRKEQVEFGMLRDFVVSHIMKPIQESTELKYQEQLKGGNLSPDQIQQIKEQVAQEVEMRTPPEVKKYMSREHQDPAEVLSNQILRYLLPKEKIKDKFQKCFKHGLIAGRQIMLVGLNKNEPFARVVNPLFFDYAKTSDSDEIEDSEWAVAEFRDSPSSVISQFRNELTDEEVKRIYSYYKTGENSAASQPYMSKSLEDKVLDFSNVGDVNINDNTVRVLYGAWKGERKVGFLKYKDNNGKPQEMLVNEDYKLDGTIGDISIEWDWVPEVHHGYKLCLPDPIYLGSGPVPGQHKDLDNLDDCKLPFIGVDYDDLNSEVTSAIDRVKGYQYFYNILLYRIELLLASDKGKILMMNMNAIPTSAGITLTKFQHFLEANKIAYYNPNEEKNKKGLADVNTIAKVLDMSLVSEIRNYIEIAEYIERKAGDAIGVPKQMEAQISSDESVRNVQQVVSASSNILEPYFQRHNTFKKNVLQALIEVAKVGYSQGKPRKLAYFLDDMSQAMLTLDSESQKLLADSILGIFVTDATNAAEAKETIKNLAHAAMQTQQMDLLDVVKVIRASDIQEAEENLTIGVEKKAKQLQEAQAAQQQAAAKEAEAGRMHEKEVWQQEEKMVRLEESLKYKREMDKQLVLSLGFNEDKDLDKDGTPDVLEVAKFGVDAQIKQRELSLKERKQTEDNDIAKQKVEVEKEKVEVAKRKTVAAK